MPLWRVSAGQSDGFNACDGLCGWFQTFTPIVIPIQSTMDDPSDKSRALLAESVGKQTSTSARSEKALPVKLLDGWSRAQLLFDDENLASHAGLVPVMALAERAGLSELVKRRVRFKSTREPSAGSTRRARSPRSSRGWPRVQIASTISV